MLKVHHLNDSRAQKTIWLLEELEEPYHIIPYQRHPVHLVAPPEMKAVHPVGKSPMIEDDYLLVIESGAIADYILKQYGRGRLAPHETSSAYEHHRQWLYYAVSSGMNPIMIKVYARAFALEGSDLDKAADAELGTVLTYIDNSLSDRDFLLGNSLTAADIQMSFIPENAQTLVPIDRYANITRWLGTLHRRPAWKRSIDRGGPYSLS